MNDPEPEPADPLAALFDATAKDAPPPDRAALDAIYERSRAAFAEAAAPATPALPQKERRMPLIRWAAAAAAALLVAGLVAGYWLANRNIETPDPRPDDKFALEKGLADDGRIGTVTDAQGVVAVKPVAAERWSPVGPRLVLKPGDWVRTDARGANAVALKLASAARVIVGPHSLVELSKPTEIRLVEGELEVTASDAAPVEVTGPDKEKVVVKGVQRFAVRKDKLARVEQEPRWLQGFKGATANESVGSLVAKVDGRDVPLTVGYHHVSVDIRDQISRTTIEESFVNTTPNTLEGVFHFPLPADASISGFGMWIGNQLVEADVVEKQRAREIYEEILREKRDPGLLEWAGGNIFKARVFPIPGRAEKRIKITYTQVLPLQGNRYRYSYALQSELLKQHPLRELKIDVTVGSAAPLKGASSPTHPARISHTAHAARVEFAAQEHTPTRDFEAVFEVEPGRPDVVVVPHRRGDDGYFMVQLTPPGAAADWERPLVPNGQPVKLLVVADTSASMDKAQRANQNAVLAALLGALTPKDTINLAACDVNCDWVFERPVPATAANVASAQDFLAKRAALGWTDLDKAFASALKMAEPGTHVVYLGDATPTTGNADPVQFAQRLARLYAGKHGTFHAVALGSTYEPAVLKAIGALGGGSVRRVSADRGPQATALDLLTEIAAPSLRDLKVEFNGLRVARVYPEVLPNVPAGTQQILLGRYKPDGTDQTGEVVVTGTLAGKPVRYASRISLKGAESGNSFVPRLWARMHLDRLLEQGRSESVRQEVIALSEEFHLITPYTSLLVLETDADRERFAVKRRFEMRDGQDFFAEGQGNAAFELKRKQMRLAADYRTALRRSVLAQLNGLGRNPNLFRPAPYELENLSLRDRNAGWLYRESGAEEFYGFPAGYAGRAETAYDFAYGPKSKSDVAEPDAWAADNLPALNKRLADGVHDGTDLADLRAERGVEMYDLQTLGGRFGTEFAERITTAPLGNEDFGLHFDLDAKKDGLVEDGGRARFRLSSRGLGTFGRLGTNPYYRGPQLQWLGTLFPTLAPPAREPKEPKTPWPAPALALSRSLLRTDALAQRKGGVVVGRQSDTLTSRGELAARTNRLELVSAGAWLARVAPDGGPVSVSWCDGKECGAYSAAFQLGRVRAAEPRDLKHPPLELPDYAVRPLHVEYAHTTPKVEEVAKGRVLLILAHRDSPQSEVRVLIDTDRRVVLSTETRYKGKVTGQTKFGDFAEVAGQWWARKVETFDDKERRTALTTQTVSEVAPEEFAKRLAQELAGKEKVLFLPQPLPTVAEAKKRTADGKATAADRAVLALHFGATQQWERALGHFQEFEKLSAGKPGVRWLRDSFLLASRRHEELRARLLAAAAQLAAAADADTRANAHFLAEHISNYAAQVLQADEQLALLDALRPVYDAQPAHVDGPKAWRTRRVALLEQAGQTDKALALAKELATAYPRDHNLQYRYAQSLANTGDYPAAYAWLDRALAAGDWDQPYHADSLRDQYASLLRQQGRYREQAAYFAAWVKLNPDRESVYAEYLAALVRSNQAAAADELIGAWLREARVDGEVPPAAAARLRAAVGFALGQVYNLWTNRLDPRWHPELAEVVRFFAWRDDFTSLVSNILSRLNSTDVGRAVRKELAARLVKEIDTLPPARVEWLMGVVWTHEAAERDAWKAVAAALRKRWTAEKNPTDRHRLGEELARVLSWLDDEAAWLAFLRERVATGPEAYRVHYAARLFELLLARAWTAEGEDEVFALVPKLGDPDEPGGELFARVAALHRLTDLMIERRYEARMKAVERPDKLTRTELAKKQEDARKAAREGFADRLRKEAAKHPQPLSQWLTAERVWLDVTLDRDLAGAATDSWALLNSPAVKADKDDPDGAVRVLLDEVLRARALAVLQNLAARKSAPPALIEQMLKYLDAQAAAEPDAPRWRAEKYKLLVALDRPKELEAELVRWTAAPGADTRWNIALGYLLAEQGRVADAIKQFERVEAADELTPPTYRALAEWYQVEDRRADFERATAAAYKATDESQLARRLNAYLGPWRSQSGPLPTKFDPEVFDVFRSLFEKSSAPQGYLYHLGQFYGASREFRLLSMLPDAVVGHTAAKVYPFLAGMGGVLSEVRDEATADQIVRRVAEVRPAAKTDVDRRALDLLELLVERRAADLENQPGPHAARALAALERAAKPAWAPGEPRLMADLLAGLGAVKQPEIAKEQLRQLEALHRTASPGAFDRLHISHRYAEALNAHSRRADATDLLQTALKEFEEANGGVLPTSANNAVQTLVSLHESAGHYDRGERFLLEKLKRPIHAEQKRWLTQRLTDLYHQALIHKAGVSLGEGVTLYKALEARLFAELNDPDQNHRYAVFERLDRVYRAARDLTFEGAAADLKAFAFGRLPKLLAEQTINYDSVVRTFAEALAALSGPRDALAFLLDRAGAEPDFRRYTSDDTWTQHNYRIGSWRSEAKDLGDLEPRLLKFVVAELKRDLRDRQSRGRAIYDRRNSYFWSEKADAFAAAAEEVLVEQKGAGDAAEFVAEYLFFGLPREKRAIEVLLTAYGQKRLTEAGRSQLADYLHRENRHAEAIPVLVALSADRPHNLAYRTRLMHAYFRTDRRDELLALLKATDVHFHEKDRWTEEALAGLAYSCLENKLYAQAAAYYEELIPRYQRARGGRVSGDGTLSAHYTHAARAYAGLGKTKEAVDMAAGAVVTWGPHSEQRKQALGALVEVLAGAADLPAYVDWLKKESLQSAVVWKAVGKAYISKNEHARAIPPLLQAAELQPEDAETYELLLTSYDKIGDPAGAVDPLLRAVEASRRDLTLYQRLGKQYAALNRPADAERAYTSLAEVSPNDSEGSAMLAEVREKQGRWADAAAHWARVAEIRALEPTGLLRLAGAQIEAGSLDAAAGTLRQLRGRAWPPRFTEVEKQTRDLERRLEQRTKK